MQSTPSTSRQPPRQPPPSRTHFPFLSLPAELRNEIYNISIEDHYEIVKTEDWHYKAPPALISVCKQTRYEGLPFYHARAVLRIQHQTYKWPLTLAPKPVNAATQTPALATTNAAPATATTATITTSLTPPQVPMPTYASVAAAPAPATAAAAAPPPLQAAAAAAAAATPSPPLLEPAVPATFMIRYDAPSHALQLRTIAPMSIDASAEALAQVAAAGKLQPDEAFSPAALGRVAKVLAEVHHRIYLRSDWRQQLVRFAKDDQLMRRWREGAVVEVPPVAPAAALVC